AGRSLYPDVFKAVAQAYPDVLLIPENESMRYFAYSAPLNSYMHHRITSTPAGARMVYPKAFSVMMAPDGDQADDHAALLNAVRLVFQCARHRKRAVIICRMVGIGDVICTLPMCDEVRRRHPGKLLVFMTAAPWRDIVILSRSADLVYGNKSWAYPFFKMPARIKLFGLVDTIYNPQTSGERVHKGGMTRHLIEDLAESCGFTITARQPRLYPSADLIEKTRIAYGLDRKVTAERLLIGINPGPNWPVKEWEAYKWQKLINNIHSEYDAVI